MQVSELLFPIVDSLINNRTVTAVILFVIGLLLLIKGGDWFVDGASGIAKKYHVPEILIGATVVSIGTTLPEVMVSATAAVEGSGAIAYGNAIGSVICNVGLIAALTMAMADLKNSGVDVVLVTSGAQQVMELATKSLCNEGDTIICEAPSFIGSLNSFRSFNTNLVGVPMEKDGKASVAIVVDGAAIGSVPFATSFAWASVRDNFIGVAREGQTAFKGTEIAEVTMFRDALSVEEIKTEAYRIRTGAEAAVTGYYSFRQGEDLVAATQQSGAFDRTFLDRVTGRTCSAKSVVYMRPGAPAKAGTVISADETPSVYCQNDPELPGYNPNEEHAFMTINGEDYVAWALRNDLNVVTSNGFTSPPCVLVEYAKDGKGAMQAFRVVTVNAAHPELLRTVEAGKLMLPPDPIGKVSGCCTENDSSYSIISADDSALVYKDRKNQMWARRGDAMAHALYSYKLEAGFWCPPSAGALPVGTVVGWMNCVSNANPTAAELKDGTKSLPWLWSSTWPNPDTKPTMRIAQTLTVAENGLPEVWNAASMAVVYPNPKEDSSKVVEMIDPTVAQSSALAITTGDFPGEYGFTVGPSGTCTLRKGKYYFRNCPPSVSDRFYVDVNADESKRMNLIGDRVVKEAGNVWAVPVIDLHALSGLYPLAVSHGRFFANPGRDLLHPSAAGHERMARTIYAQLLALPPNFKPSAPADDTAKLQRRIDEVSAAGGGKVTVAPGDYEVRGLELKSNVTLELAKGARLLATTNWADCGCCPDQPKRIALVWACGATNVALVGTLTVGDRVRDRAADTVKALKKKGIVPVMLTGDGEEQAARVAREVGIERVFSGLLPHQKAEKLETLEGPAAFVGDGLNDAPVLWKADVGLAMGGLGSDAAKESAGIVLMNDRLTGVTEARNIAEKAVHVAKENIVLSLLVKAAVVILGLLGAAPMALAVFADVGVMLLAVLNALRAGK